MKARPFLAVLLAVVLSVLALGVGGWWLVWQRSPLQLQHRPLVMPRAARFVPVAAPLSLHLFSDAQEPVDYVRAVVAPRQRRQAADALERLRDGAFAAAGLDYRDELASWLAPGLGLALFDSGADEPGGWLLALSSRDADGARRFLQRFWQTRSLAGTDLQVSSYRGMGLISGRGALRGREPVPLATALVDDDLVLIASGRGVLEQALDVSQIDELNLGSLPALRQGLGDIAEAAALVVARPAAFSSWLGLPAASSEAAPSLLLAGLRPDGEALRLEALLQPGAATTALSSSLSSSSSPASTSTSTASIASTAAASGPMAASAPTAALPPDALRDSALLAGLRGPIDSLALLRDPQALAQRQLPALLLERLLPAPGEAGPLPSLLAASADGPLLAATGPQGWLLASPAGQPPLEALAAPLAAQGLVGSALEHEGESLQVWTRLSSGRGDQLQVSLAGWRHQEGPLAWWGQELAQLGALDRSEPLRRRLVALGSPSSPLRWVLAGDGARALLQPWRPWRLLAALSGGDPAAALRGLGLAVEPQPDGGLRLQALLSFGS